MGIRGRVVPPGPQQSGLAARCGLSTPANKRGGLSIPCKECGTVACKPRALQQDVFAAPHGVVIKNWKGCSLEFEDGLRCCQ